MCVGIPGKVVQVKNKKARVKQGDHCHWWDISLLDKKVSVGDYLIAYQNAAINKITPSQAKEVFKLIK